MKDRFLFVRGGLLGNITLIILTYKACAQRANYAQNCASKLCANLYLKYQNAINDLDSVTR